MAITMLILGIRRIETVLSTYGNPEAVQRQQLITYSANASSFQRQLKQLRSKLSCLAQPPIITTGVGGLHILSVN